MLGKTLPEYIFILISIATLNLIAPASLVWIIFYTYYYIYLNSDKNLVLSTCILGYALLETLFLFGVYWPRKRRLVKEALYDTPERLTRTEREVLFTKCASVVFPPYTTYPSGWFIIPNQDSVSLRRQNVIEWLLWALFACELENALLDEWKDEIDSYIRRIEDRLGYKLEGGHDEDAKCMRLTFDELKSNYRPLVWYIIVGIVDFITSCRLCFHGFKHYTPERSNFPIHFFSVLPFRPLNLFSNTSATPYLPYWYRPHKSTTKDPIVFIHGIGIGLYPYVPTITSLVRDEPDVGILLVELLPISNRILMPFVRPSFSVFPIPTTRTMLDALYRTMFALGAPWGNAVLVTHSYGTVVAAYDVRARAEQGIHPQDRYPDEENYEYTLSPPVPQFTSYILIDPIPFLLNLPPVAYNFMYRAPWRSRSDSPFTAPSSSSGTDKPSLWQRFWTGYNGNEWQLWYFASRDLEVAYTLSRRFFWESIVLWKEDLLGGKDSADAQSQIGTGAITSGERRDISSSSTAPSGSSMAVVLSGDDQIIPASTVKDYLIGASEEIGGTAEWKNYDMGCYIHHTKTSTMVPPSGSPSPVLREILYYPGLDHATVFDTRQRRQGLIEVIRRFCVATNA
ncbi:hypothetical protein L218DRAFT_895241 [Marasmius fiardii PR-910]|nr:hypothetical protein L218DRAFT_895241 [Marasmius fiardii PR-910]